MNFVRRMKVTASAASSAWHRGRTVENLGEGVVPMWFFVGAIIVIALIAVWFSRTNLYGARGTGRNVKSGQAFGGDLNAPTRSSLRPPRGDSRPPGRS